MADPIVIANVTAEQLNEMVGAGRAKIEPIMTGQWKISIDGKDVGNSTYRHIQRRNDCYVR